MKLALLQAAVLVTLLAIAASASAQTLRESLKDIPVASHWIYDDLPKAIAQAKETGQPLLVVLRCVPCPPGRTLDENVMQPDDDLAKLEQQFVCVRVIQTNGLDLNVFQYDYDMSWAAMFLNPDMTVYGRYGSRTASGKESDGLLTTAGFRAAAERALALHKAYPGNKEALAAKTGKPGEYATPTEIPGLTEKPQRSAVRHDCIHCHMVKEFALRAKWEAGQLTGEDLWVYPMPQRIGLTLDLQDGLVVEAVRDGSPAEMAGIARGDRLVSLGGQPLVSTADVQWVLHHAPSNTRLAAVIERGEQRQEKTIVLSGDWKKSDIAWRASSWYGLRQGVKFDPLPAAEREKRGIDEGQMALVVARMYARGAQKLQEAGVKANDVIVAVDGRSDLTTETDFLANLRLNHGPKDTVKFTVLRGRERKEIVVPLW